MASQTTKQQQTFDALKASMGYENVMQSPKVTKVIVSVGVGSIKDKKRTDLIKDRLVKITGQAPASRGAKKSVANFKIREGDLSGFQITLRGERMRSFLDKLINVVFPRIKDFRGLNPDSIDEMGNATLGIREHTVFPETSDEDARDVFGLSVNISTTAKSKKEAEAFLRHLGMPLRERT